MQKNKRTLALLLVLLLVFGVLVGFGSAFLLVHYPGHTCCGQHCLFCDVLNVMDVLLHQSSFAVTFGAMFAVLSAAAVSCVKRVGICRPAAHTPITLKTKLLN